MSDDLSQVNPTPSVDEFLGFYNVPCDTMSGYPVLRTAKRLFAIDFQERFDVEGATAKLFRTFLPEVEPSPGHDFDPLYQPPFFVRDTGSDRTLCVDVIFERMTVQLLIAIKERLLRQFPLWRVIVIGEDPANAIAIYPRAIRFAKCSPDVDNREALRQLIPIEQALRESRMRPKRAYYRQVRILLLQAVESIARLPFFVAGIINNYLGNRPSLAICIVVNGTDDNAIDLEVPPECGDQYLSRASPLGVDVLGRIVCEYPIEGNAPYCLTTWCCPADYRGPIWIIETATGARQQLELTTEIITRTEASE